MRPLGQTHSLLICAYCDFASTFLADFYSEIFQDHCFYTFWDNYLCTRDSNHCLWDTGLTTRDILRQFWDTLIPLDFSPKIHWSHIHSHLSIFLQKYIVWSVLTEIWSPLRVGGGLYQKNFSFRLSQRVHSHV